MILHQVRELYSSAMRETHQIVTTFPWENRDAYALWLAQSYFFVQHSTRLLALASGLASLSSETIHRRMVEHLREEIGHDKIALADLRELGFTTTSNEDRTPESLPELVQTRAFYQSQYYWIQQHSSAAFLGYILFLEGLAATQGPRILAITQAAFGDKAVRFVKVHAEEDPAHVEKAFESLRGLSEEELTSIGENMWSSMKIYSFILREIQERVAPHQRANMFDPQILWTDQAV